MSILGLGEAVVHCFRFCAERVDFGEPRGAAAKAATLQLEVELDFLEHSLEAGRPLNPKGRPKRGQGRTVGQ